MLHGPADRVLPRRGLRNLRRGSRISYRVLRAPYAEFGHGNFDPLAKSISLFFLIPSSLIFSTFSSTFLSPLISLFPSLSHYRFPSFFECQFCDSIMSQNIEETRFCFISFRSVSNFNILFASKTLLIFDLRYVILKVSYILFLAVTIL